MAKKSDTTKQVEANTQQNIGETALESIHTPKPVAIYTRSKDSNITNKHQNVSLPNICYRNKAIDVSGSFVTGANGRSEFLLTDFICSEGERFNYPINIVATPFSSKPFFLTIIYALVGNGANIKFTVYAWDANGNPAPNIPFCWRCRVQVPIIVI